MFCHSTLYPLLYKTHNKIAVQMKVLFPEPAGLVRNIRSWSLPPLAFNFLITSLASAVVAIFMVCCRYPPNFVFLSLPSFTNPRRNVQTIISYAIYCFSSNWVFSSLATFRAICGRIFFAMVFVTFVHITTCGGCVFVFIGVNI